MKWHELGNRWYDLVGICSNHGCNSEGDNWCVECGRPVCWYHTIHRRCAYCMDCRARACIAGKSGYIHLKNRINTPRVIRKRVRSIVKSWWYYSNNAGTPYDNSLVSCPGILDKFNLTLDKDKPRFNSRDRARAKQWFINEIKMENGGDEGW